MAHPPPLVPFGCAFPLAVTDAVVVMVPSAPPLPPARAIRAAQMNHNVKVAAWNGDTDALGALLAQGADERVDHHHALTLATCQGHNAATKMLCEAWVDRWYDADVCARHAALRDVHGVFIVAAQHGRLRLVRALCALPREFGIEPSVDGNAALHAAAIHGHVEVVQCLLALDAGRGVDPGTRQGDILLRAIATGRVQVALVLLRDARTDPIVGDNAILRCAARYGHSTIVATLRQLSAAHAVDPAARSCEAVVTAARMGHVDVMREFIAPWGRDGRRLDLAVNDNATLKMAACHGHTGIVRMLLRVHGVDPSVGDNLVLRKAAARGHLGVVQELLALPTSRGVDPAARSHEALRAATLHGHERVADLLHRTAISRAAAAAAAAAAATAAAAAAAQATTVRVQVDLRVATPPGATPPGAE